jgi:hypothetical protein
MSGKVLFNGASPKTQSIDAVKNLLAFVGRASDPLPTDVSLDNGSMVLVLSNKKDSYYCLTAKTCSCPANTWHPNHPCKHQRKYFGTKLASSPTEAASIRPTAGWIGPDGQRANGPVEA